MRLLLLQMELSLTGLLLYLGAFHLKQRNSLSTVRTCSKWESILTLHRILTAELIIHSCIYFLDYTAWFIFIFHGSQKVFKEQLNLPWRTLFHHTMPFCGSLGPYTVSRQRGGLSGLTSLIFLSIHRSSILLTGVLPSAYTISTEMILS